MGAFISAAQAQAPNEQIIPLYPYIQATNGSVTLKTAPGTYLATKDGYCVSFVKEHGFSQFNGDAHEWIKYIDSSVPVIGSVLVTNEGTGYGHLALVVGVDYYNVYLVEQNFKGRWIVSYRTIPRTYNRIIGYIKAP